LLYDFVIFSLRQIADAYSNRHGSSLESKQRGLLYALYVTPFICAIGAWAYIIGARYLGADKLAADEEALLEADVPPTSALDNMPVSSGGTSEGAGGNAPATNPPVNRILVPDIYDHIQGGDSDGSDSYEEDEEDDRSRLIYPGNKPNKRTERIV